MQALAVLAVAALATPALGARDLKQAAITDAVSRTAYRGAH